MTTRKSEGVAARVMTICPDPAMAAQAEAILTQLRSLGRELRHNPFADAERAGLTGPQVSVMTVLVTRGPMPLTDLSRALSMSHSTASGIVDRLQARGLVRRSEDARDRRRMHLSVTEQVTRYVGQLEGGSFGRLAAALARATPAERRAIRNGLNLLQKLLS